MSGLSSRAQLDCRVTVLCHESTSIRISKFVGKIKNCISALFSLRNAMKTIVIPYDLNQ